MDRRYPKSVVVFVSPLIHGSLNGTLCFVKVLCPGFCGACNQHFCSFPNTKIVFRAYAILALFWISMHVRNANSFHFLIKLTPENCLQQASA